MTEDNSQNFPESGIIQMKSTPLLSRYLPSLIMIIAGATLILSARFFVPTSLADENLITYLGLGGLILMVIGAGSSSLSYLSGGFRRTIPQNDTSTKVDEFAEVVAGLTDRMEQAQLRAIEEIRDTAQTRISLSDADLEELKDAFKKQVSGNLSEELLKSLSQTRGTRFDKIELTELRTRTNQVKARLVAEVVALSRRGNLNLVIGGVTTVLAVGLLIYIVLNASPTLKPEDKDLDALLWHYVPRLSVVVFIEIFSFFFLRLYKNSLDDVKYFQNEITNVEVRMISLEAALLSDNQTNVETVVKSLAQTERNFKLQKGESTVDLEKAKSDSQGIKDFVSNVTSILRKVK